MLFKKLQYHLLVVLLLLIASCSPPVTFDQPQPPNSPLLTEFPKRLQGVYVSADKSAIMYISSKMAIVNFDFELKISYDSLEKLHPQGDTMLATGRPAQLHRVTIVGDTAYINNRNVDTLFNISDKNVLKKFRGYYFMNSLYDKNMWTIQRVSLSNGQLTLSDISDSAHINQLREITETPADTICTNFKLNQKQFKQLLKKENFDQTQQFTRISN